MKKFNYKSPMQIPRFDKIVIKAGNQSYSITLTDNYLYRKSVLFELTAGADEIHAKLDEIAGQ